MDKEATRIDPRKLRTRQLLRDAYVDLLQEMDPEKITVNRLAERARINRVTFYLHYLDIPDMVDKISEEMIENIYEILRDKTSTRPTPIEDRDSLVELLEHIAENAIFYKATLATNRIPIFTERLLNLLSELIIEKLENTRSQPCSSTANIQNDIAIWYGSSALIGVIVAWLRNDMPYMPSFLAKQFSLLTLSR
ncbi:TetR/AcrR family transcriptional regulator [Paenibacillus sp. LjRoot56]|uniref:TetR/AcrR family transcriptional regulator n=1 Tax=Paenibacillus sp. LjRoot56 TaxID=3342333 RepID=UPI003ECCF9E5